MQLEEFFEFETFETKFGRTDRIRIKGTRIAIEHLVRRFNEGAAPEVILRSFYPSLTLEQVYATITYYLHKRESVEEYIKRGEKIADAFYQEYLSNEPPVVARLRAVRAEQEAKHSAS